MKTAFVMAAVGLVGQAAAAQAQRTNSPPVYWAGCAGALVVKAQRSGEDQGGASFAPMARKALAQAKRAPNPDKLSPQQIDGVAISAARTFTAELKGNPARVPAFEKAVQLCAAAVAKLPA
jgi:hypothetical protein